MGFAVFLYLFFSFEAKKYDSPQEVKRASFKVLAFESVMLSMCALSICGYFFLYEETKHAEIGPQLKFEFPLPLVSALQGVLSSSMSIIVAVVVNVCVFLVWGYIL